MSDKTRVFNQDCMIGMKEFPDKYFDLAIVDVPYGIGEDGISNHSRNKAFGNNSNWGEKNTRKTIIPAKKYLDKQWDNDAPDLEYFHELRRVSKNQVVWGANHFISRIPIDSSCWIVWDKDNGDSHFSDCELAWTSFDTAVRKITWRWNGMLQQNMKQKDERIHPTQKPIALYKWLLKNYAKEGNKILDTHLGSQSSRIAAFDMGFDFTGYELDADYFEAGNKRFNQHKSQLKLFNPTPQT